MKSVVVHANGMMISHGPASMGVARTVLTLLILMIPANAGSRYRKTDR